MPSYGNYRFHVFSGGKVLEEFEMVRDGPLCSCWIASEEGQNFTIKWTGVPRGKSLRCDVLLDGTLVKSPLHHESIVVNLNIEGCFVDERTEKLFAFAKVESESIDDQANTSVEQNTSELGTIELRVYSVKVPTSETNKLRNVNACAVHNHSKKSRFHGVCFKGIRERKRRSVFCETKLLESVPHARFIFKHRSKEFLRAQGIMPPDDNIPHKTSCESDEETQLKHEPDSSPSKNKKRTHEQSEEWSKIRDKRMKELRAREEANNTRQMQELQVRLDLFAQREKDLARRDPLPPVDDNGVIDLTGD